MQNPSESNQHPEILEFETTAEKLLEILLKNSKRTWCCGTCFRHAMRPYCRKLRREFDLQELQILLFCYQEASMNEIAAAFPHLSLNKETLLALLKRLEHALLGS